MIVDEVEKAGQACSTKGHAFGLAEALLPLLEPLTARRWSCPYYQVKFDMSWVIWVMTSNDCRLLPEPLLSRCPPIRLSMKLSPSDCAWFDKVLRAIATVEAGPSDADLAQAPVLHDWKPAISPGGHVMLWGEVTDHPLLGNASIHTSQLIAINQDAGWARTASRWYGSAGPSTNLRRNWRNP